MSGVYKMRRTRNGNFSQYTALRVASSATDLDIWDVQSGEDRNRGKGGTSAWYIAREPILQRGPFVQGISVA